MNRCLNCGTELSDIFCPHCGQALTGRITFRSIGLKLYRQFTGFDYRIVRTFLGLSVSPGHVAKEYILGRRVQYTNPLTYAFLLTTLYVVAITASQIELRGALRDLIPLDEAEYRRVFALAPYLTFPLLVPIAALQRWLFRDEGFNVAECYAFTSFIYGHVFIVHVVVAFLIGLGWLTGSLLVVGFLVVVVEVPFLSWSLMEFYSTRTLKTVLKSLLLYVARWVFGAVLFLLLLFASSRM